MDQVPLRVLVVEDSPDDELLLLRQLRGCGFAPSHIRVDTPEGMRAALDDGPWDVVISDYVMPRFCGADALALVRERGLDLPFIIVSGTISEEIAVGAMKAGAHDYVFKGNLARLVPAIERELREAQMRRRERDAQRVEQERNELRRSLAAQEQALSVVSHELRSPLAGVRAMAEMLMTDVERGTDQFGHYLTAIHQEVLRMSRLVNDLLEVARINSGSARWNWSVVSVAQACADAVESARPLLGDRAVSLSSEVSPTKLTLHGDADAVRRLVLNLVNNAAKFTPAGSIRVTAAAVSDVDGRWVEVRVSDTGQGMTAETAAKLGKAFALNSGLVGDSPTGGTGLGLAICTGIAAAHGGTISVASELDRGTTVTVRLRSDLVAPMEAAGDGAHAPAA